MNHSSLFLRSLFWFFVPLLFWFTLTALINIIPSAALSMKKKLQLQQTVHCSPTASKQHRQSQQLAGEYRVLQVNSSIFLFFVKSRKVKVNIGYLAGFQVPARLVNKQLFRGHSSSEKTFTPLPKHGVILLFFGLKFDALSQIKLANCIVV